MRILGLLAGVLVFAAAQAASAQTNPSTEAHRAALKAAFEETLKRPGDPPTLLRYAEAAIQACDLEAAISALERLLLLDGDQPRVKLELGVLYYRLGSIEAARSYLEDARSSERATAEVKARANQYLAEIDSQASRSKFSADFITALRWSNNATSGPVGLIMSAGSPTVPDPAITRRPDFSVLAVAALRHRYDLGRQDGGAFETDLTLYKARQFAVNEAHIFYADLFLGPKTEPFDGWLDDMAIKPFFTGRYISVHDLDTYLAYGMGLEVSGPFFSDRVHAAYTLFGRRRNFFNNSDSSTGSRSSGNEMVNTAEFRINVASGVTLGLNAAYTRFIGDLVYESNAEYSVSASLGVRFTDPVGINGRPWTVTASAALQRADYDQADPNIDPFTRRRQNDLNLGLVLGIPLDAQLSVIAQATYSQRHASVNNYAYDAFTTMLGMGWRF